MSLSHIRTLMYHVEHMKNRTLDVELFDDDVARATVQEALDTVKMKSEVLNRLAAEKESEGEVDDGGDVLPSQRDNICKTIEGTTLDVEFRQQVMSLCNALDAVRANVLAGEDLEPSVLNVNGRLMNLRGFKDVRVPGVEYMLVSLMAEEFRWVTKQLAGRPTAAPGVDFGLLRVWMNGVVNSKVLDPSERELRLQHASVQVQAIQIEEQRTLADVRNSLHVLEVCKEIVAECIMTSDDAFRERIRDLLRMVKEKAELLRPLAEKMEAAGEVDEVMEVTASKRDNICRNIDDYGLDADWRQCVVSVCKTFDDLRAGALAGEDTDEIMLDLLGRMNMVKTKPGYHQVGIAGELERVYSEECRWFFGFKAAMEEANAGRGGALEG